MLDVVLCWGKSLKVFESTRIRATHHPAICHMLDVGLMSQALLEQAGVTVKRLLCDPLNCEDSQKILWLAFFVALHDLGKISPGFQYKREDLIEGILKRKFGSIWKKRYPLGSEHDVTDHGRVLFKTLPQLLNDKTQCGTSVVRGLARTLAAHHGSFPADSNDDYHPDKKEWPNLRKQVADEILKVFGLEWQDFPLKAGQTPPASFFMTLAGLTSVADWLGSDESRFYYIGAEAYSPDFDFQAYAKQRQEIANNVLADLSLKPAVSTQQQPHDFSALFPFKQANGEPASANACQQAALELAGRLPEGQPALFIIETPMGSGKTEAALAIADRWLCQGTATGIYYALPTQATANQMLGRVWAFLDNNSAIEKTELHLLHAHAELQPEYRKLFEKTLQIASICDADKNAKLIPGEVQASEWFAARKRGLLASFAVGTVDQALLAVLRQARHMFVRLYGLAGKVVVIDECHAYDTYTSTLLEGLLSWLSIMNTPVILLSATLPTEMRRKLLQAYAPEADLPKEVSYPCIIAADREAKTALYEPVKVALNEGDEGLKPATFQLHLLKTGPSPEERWAEVEKTLREQLQDGGCALCVLNTVVEAQSLYQHLAKKDDFKDIMLFHARFPLGQRLAIEDRCKDLFGKDQSKRPGKAILIATQVAEQSLDVNFDLLITDLAPIDLILQRMGRTHRHPTPNRPERLRQAQVFCLMPDLGKKTGPNLGRSKKVYHPVRLARTALLLDQRLQKGQTGIRLPEDVEELIAAVYDAKDEDVPEHLKPYFETCALDNEVENKCKAVIALGEQLPRSSSLGDMDFFADLQCKPIDDELVMAVTRLSDPSIVLILLHQDGRDRLFFDQEFKYPVDLKAKPDREMTEKLLRQSVSISRRDCYEYFKGKINEENRFLPKTWEKSPLLCRCRCVRLTDGRYRFDEGTLTGKELVLDEVRGLILP